jgi:4'-phosphopantetheinyl transferase
MIDWLLTAPGAAPRPDVLLAPVERARLDALRVAPRRADWLLGRWAAKQLLRACLGDDLAYDALVVDNEPSGAPYASHAGARLPLSLSLSHRAGRALAAVCARPGVRLGADLELIEPRTEAFVADYFTPVEQAQIATSGTRRDAVVAALWSAKEAALKALELGLTVDTRRVECILGAPVPGGWAPVRVAALCCGVPPFGDSEAEGGSLDGWWREYDGFVLALVTYAGGA